MNAIGTLGETDACLVSISGSVDDRQLPIVVDRAALPAALRIGAGFRA